jgi:hypothetical protein
MMLAMDFMLSDDAKSFRCRRWDVTASSLIEVFCVCCRQRGEKHALQNVVSSLVVLCAKDTIARKEAWEMVEEDDVPDVATDIR